MFGNLNKPRAVTGDHHRVEASLLTRCYKVAQMVSPWFRVNYNELTTSSLEIIVSKGNHAQMALIQVLRGGGRPKGRSVALIQVSELL